MNGNVPDGMRAWMEMGQTQPNAQNPGQRDLGLPQNDYEQQFVGQSGRIPEGMRAWLDL